MGHLLRRIEFEIEIEFDEQLDSYVRVAATVLDCLALEPLEATESDSTVRAEAK